MSSLLLRSRATQTTLTIRFWNVGREKRSWEIRNVPVTITDAELHRRMFRSIKTRRALWSNDVEFAIDLSFVPQTIDVSDTPVTKVTGTIVVGGFRSVGTWEILYA